MHRKRPRRSQFRATESEIITDEPKQWSIVVSFDNMSRPINREVDLAHDNDGDSDFGLRHERRPACSNFAVTFQRLPISVRWLISDRRIRPAHLPPKNLRNDLKTRPGMENAFCGAPWSC